MIIFIGNFQKLTCMDMFCKRAHQIKCMFCKLAIEPNKINQKCKLFHKLKVQSISFLIILLHNKLQLFYIISGVVHE